MQKLLNFTRKLLIVKNKLCSIVIELLVSNILIYDIFLSRIYLLIRSCCLIGYTNLNQQEKVVEDTTSALRLDPSYIKALNRRGIAREQIGGVDALYLAVCGKCLFCFVSNIASANVFIFTSNV